MPGNNSVHLFGSLAVDPYFQPLPDGTPYLRFILVVERDTDQMPKAAKAQYSQRADLIRVVEYGIKAEVDYYYLRKGASVAVYGWNQSRSYTDRRSGKALTRNQLEVNAKLIVYGRSCDFERGDRHRADIAEREGERGVVLLDEMRRTSGLLTDPLLKMLSVEAE